MMQTLCWTGTRWSGKAWAEKPGQVGRMEQKGTRTMPMFSLTSLERALLRLLVSGYPIGEAAPLLGLSLPEAETIVSELQLRCGVASYTRLLVLAVLKAWV